MNDRLRPGPLHKFSCGVVAAVALLGITVHAKADAPSPSPLPIDLGWEAPESCPRSDDIDRDVRRFLGDASISASVAPIAAQVTLVEHADRTFVVRVRTTSGGAARERELSVKTCDEARELVAFLLAFLIDPNAHDRSRPEPTPTDTTAPPAASAPPAPAPPAAPAPLDEDSMRAFVPRYPEWIVGAAVVGDAGLLPSPSVGAELRTGLLFSRWSVEAHGAAWLPRRAESSTFAGAGGEFMLLDAGAALCVRLALWQGHSIRMCAGPALLSLRGSGDGVEVPGADSALFGAGTAEAAALLAISAHTSLRLGVEALVPFRRPTFAIHGVGAIHRPGAVAGRASLGLEVHF